MSANNRTDWPLGGGSVKINIIHSTSVVFINLALGDSVVRSGSFNYTLTPIPLNVTGKGELCLPQVPVPAGVGVTDGLTGSLQVMLYGWDGQWTYNVRTH